MSSIDPTLEPTLVEHLSQARGVARDEPREVSAHAPHEPALEEPACARPRHDGGFAHLVVLAAASVLGTLGVLVVAGVGQYSSHSKTAEATRFLGAIEIGEKYAFQQDTDLGGAGQGPYAHKFCPSAAAVPAKIPAASRYQPTTADWDTDAWRCLKFSIAGPIRYQLGVVDNGKTSTDAGYVATARGDLDGDGVTSKFELEGRGGASGDAERVRFTVRDEDE